jgi:hypothetical protein
MKAIEHIFSPLQLFPGRRRVRPDLVILLLFSPGGQPRAQVSDDVGILLITDQVVDFVWIGRQIIELLPWMIAVTVNRRSPEPGHDAD